MESPELVANRVASRGLVALALACVLAPAPAARAQRAATEAPPVRSPHAFPNVGLGARIGGGVAYASGVSDAGLARLDYETFLYIAPRGTVGGLFGFLTGFDYWDGEPNDWGIGMPTAVVLGMRAVVVRGYVGFGVNAFTVDQVDDDTGFGWCSPLALANLGLDIHGLTVMGDARVSRRWQLGADDHTQWMFSIMIGATLEPRHNPRVFEPDATAR